MESATELHVPSGDVNLFVRLSGGDGEPAPALVLLHGGPGLSHHYMVPLQQRLASPSLRAVCFDQRGTGSSTRSPHGCYDLDAYVSDLEALRLWLRVDRWIVLGHSWGTLIAQAYAGAHPDRVAGLVLISSMSPREEDNRLARSGFIDRVQDLVARGRIPSPSSSDAKEDCRGSMLSMMPAYFGDPATPIDPALERTACSSSVYRATTRMVRSYDLADSLRALQAPAAIFAGDLDPFGTGCSIAVVEALRHLGPMLEVFAGVGHFPWLEDPSTMDSIEAFVRSVSVGMR